MKKVLITLLIFLVIGLLSWFLLKDNPAPLSSDPRNDLPFGSGDNLPDINQGTTNPTSTSTVDNTDSTTFPNSVDRSGNLLKISDAPVAGTIAFTRNRETYIRFVDRATGHIYETNPQTGETVKITNQTLPKIYEAHFRPDGNAVLLRYLKNDSDVIENLSITLTPPRATSTATSSNSSLYTITSVLLRGDMGSVAAGIGDTLFYTLEDASSIASSNFSGSNLKTILNSKFRDWRIIPTNNLVLQTKSSAGALGYAYTLNINNGSLTRIVGSLNGLVVTPNSSGNRVIYSYVENGLTKLFSRNMTSSATSEILPTTIAEKCVWSSKSVNMVFCGMPVGAIGASEPDNWYQGKTSFSDTIWRFNTETEVAELLSEPKNSLSVDIDIYKPQLSPNEDYLVFLNKRDLKLWALKLE